MSAVPLRAQGTAELRGRVTITGSLTGIERAIVALDASPTNGVPEYSVQTDAFGFFAFSGINAGSYSFQVSRWGFTTNQTDIVVNVGERSVRNAALTPLGGAYPPIDLTVQVTDATTGLPLDGIPVAVMLFNAPGDANPAQTITAVSDVNGVVELGGLNPAYFRFRFNDPSDGAVRAKWEPYTTLGKVLDKQLLTNSHLVPMMLKPVLQDLTVEVRGFDPAASPNGAANQPLNDVYVELTGISPTDTNIVVVPTRVGSTGPDGRVEFKGLMAVKWRIQLKKLGYVFAETFLTPDADDNLPASPVVLNLSLAPTALRVKLPSPYYQLLTTNLSVRLTGLTNTTTAGIARTNSSDWMVSISNPSETTFTNILPGRYELTVSGTNVSPVFRSGRFVDRTFTAAFRGSGYGEAVLGTTQSVNVPVQVQPAVIRGRLFVAEQTSRYTAGEQNGSKYYRGGLPVYQPRGHTNILFKQSGEANYIDTFTGATNNNTFRVAAETNGEFTVTISPGSYGVVLPGLDGYVGSGARFEDVTAGASSDEGWPFHYAQFSGISFPFTAHHGLGLPFSSGHEYQLDLFVRKQVYDVRDFVEDTSAGYGLTLVKEDLGQNISQVSFNYSDLAGAGIAILTDTNGATVTNALAQWRIPPTGEPRPDASLTFRDVPPGSYSIQVQHPRYTATLQGGASVWNFNLPFWGSPGILLPNDWQNAYFPMDDFIDEGVNSQFNAVRNSAVTLPETSSYRLTLTAVSSEDPSLVISNTTVVLDSTHTVTVPFDHAAFNGDYRPDRVTHPNWEQDLTGTINSSVMFRLVDLNRVDVKVFMKRGMGVSGLVAITNGGGGLPNVPVIIRDIHGQPLRRAVTTNDGGYQVSQALKTAQALFVDVPAPGYYPSRVRAIPDPGSATPDLVTLNQLTLLPPPTNVVAAVDRYGIFLSGVSKAGNQTVFDSQTANQALSMTWTTRVDAAHLRYSLPNFNQPDGSAAAETPYAHYDQIEEVWLIDARSFSGSAYNGTPVLANPPNPATPGELHDWLRAVADGSLPNVFHRRTRQIDPADTEGRYATGGTVRLDELPPGILNLYVVTVTRLGAVLVTPIAYPAQEQNKYLKGIPTPPWMAAVLDTMGTLPTATRDVELKFTLPTGRIKPTGTFTSTITAPGNFLLYDWNLEVELEEGQDAPGGGILALAVGKYGLQAKAGMKATVNGADGEISASVSAALGATDVNKAAYTPPILGKLRDTFGAQIKLGAGVGAETLSVLRLDEANYPNERQVTVDISGTISSELSFDFTDFAKKVPYIGPVITAADLTARRLTGTNGLSLTTKLESLIGLKSVASWNTVFPRTFEYPPPGHTVLPVPGKQHVWLRDFAGGYRRLLGPPPATNTFSNNLFICAGSKLSLEGEFTKRAKLTGFVSLEGQDCGLGKALILTPNSIGDWPPIKRIDGQIVFEVEAKLDLYAVQLSKKWNPIKAIPIAIQFGTDPIFDLVPLSVTPNTLIPANSSPVTFVGVGTNLIHNFYPSGRLAVAGGSADALLFTDIEAGTGNMVLRVSLRGPGGGFLAPVTLGVADGIIAADITPLPGGGWLAAWT